MLKVLVIVSFLLNNSFAQSTILNKGDTAPYTGVLLTKERAEKAMKAEKAKIVLEDLRFTQERLIKYHKDDASLQRKKLSQEKFKSNIYNIGYFVLGVVLASYAFKIQQEINRW